MRVEVVCPACGTSYLAPVRLSGLATRCKCGRSITVPAVPPPVPASAPPPPADDDSDLELILARRRTRSSSAPGLVVGGVLLAGLAVAAVVAVRAAVVKAERAEAAANTAKAKAAEDAARNDRPQAVAPKGTPDDILGGMAGLTGSGGLKADLEAARRERERKERTRRIAEEYGLADVYDLPPAPPSGIERWWWKIRYGFWMDALTDKVFMLLWFLSATAMAVVIALDVKERPSDTPAVWVILPYILSVVGLILYFVSRPDRPRRVA